MLLHEGLGIEMIISDIWRYIIIQVIIEPTPAGAPGTFVLSFLKCLLVIFVEPGKIDTNI